MRLLHASCLAVAMLLASANVSAEAFVNEYDDTPSSGEMAFDLLVVRPLALVGTVAGVGLFVVDLPFSILRGKPPAESAERFIIQPARFTFTRDLGRMSLED